MIHILIGIAIIILCVVLTVSIDLFLAFCWHRCPYCNHRMKHDHVKMQHGYRIHSFYCPECGAWDNVQEEDLIKHNCQEA